MPPAKRRTDALRAEILDAAWGLLSTGEGVGELTTRAVARLAGTSPPAVYELFGDKSGLVRAIYFEGFRRLHEALEAAGRAEGVRADLVLLVNAYRGFMTANPVIADVMFSQPFTDFSPGPDELAATAAVRVSIVERAQDWTVATGSERDATDLAHLVVAQIQGLAFAENGRRLGTTQVAIDRRWRLAVNVLAAAFDR